MKIDINKFIKAIVDAKPENVSSFKFGGGEYGEIQCTFWNPYDKGGSKTYKFHVQLHKPILIDITPVSTSVKVHSFEIFQEDVVATDYGQSPSTVMQTLRYQLLQLGEAYTNLRISRLYK